MMSQIRVIKKDANKALLIKDGKLQTYLKRSRNSLIAIYKRLGIDHCDKCGQEVKEVK